MNTAEFFLKGLMVGFMVAAPVGPVAVMCIHRTIAHGRFSGYICGLGATIADTLFGAIAALGLGFIATELIANQGWIRNMGGAILVALGLRLALSRHLTKRAERQERQEEEEEHREEERGPEAQAPPAEEGLHDPIGNFASAFAVMITNPITLFSFATIFAAIDIAGISDKARYGASLITGVFLGGALWWSLLITGASLWRHRIDEKGILWVSRCSGILILVFGVVILFFPELLPRRGAP